ncbi:MAG TPA: hypothetical protein PK054_07625 [Anaerohalosphaeraceae bacterium]|nr:hypothetical protein [Anaerohalosphaeraceae bacterium]HOL88509.1 hypothetical protein [Anaerohalosphaeraceae bacterium]HPP56437.1 hypothetical protein [Anaerohalosphaeraceae bacterium]
MMKKTMTAVLLFLAGMVSAGVYSGGGDGTEGNPYRISAPADWQVLMTTPQDWDKHFQLTGDLDLTGIALTPVGTVTTKFTGVFHGEGWSISNVQLSRPMEDNVGLFGWLAGARIRDLRIENGYAEGRFWVGGLVGRAESSVLENCGWTGSVKGIAYVGGIAGCSIAPQSALLGCRVMGTVTGNRYVGGITGYFADAVLYYSYSQASVIGVLDPLGGTAEAIGGLVGWTAGSATLIAKCYAAGLVQPPSTSTPNVGGLVGLNSGAVIANSFWDMQVSGQNTSAGGTGKTTAQMKQSATYIDAGWDFINLWEIGEHQTYPYIRNRPSADLNRDGRVALEDLSILAGQWLTEDIQAPSEP